MYIPSNDRQICTHTHAHTHVVYQILVLLSLWIQSRVVTSGSSVMSLWREFRFKQMAFDCVYWCLGVLSWSLGTSLVETESPGFWRPHFSLQFWPKHPGFPSPQLIEIICDFKSHEQAPSDRVDRHRQAEGTVSSVGGDCSPDVLSRSDGPFSSAYSKCLSPTASS